MEEVGITAEARRFMQIQPIAKKIRVRIQSVAAKNDPVVADSVTNGSSWAVLRRYATKGSLSLRCLSSHRG